MSDQVIVPFKFDGAQAAVAAIAAVEGSLSALERRTLALAKADNESRAALAQLDREFTAGRLSAEQYRAALVDVTASAGREAVEVRRSAEAHHASSESAGRSAEAAGRSAFGFNQIMQAASTARATLADFASSVATLAAEQERLDANSARLGLDFDRAADAAGRFTDETEAMGAASRLSEAGIALTQEQLDGLTRVAARFAQNTGTTTASAIDALTNGLITGSARGLRPFGAELQAVAGGSHTAEQRLSALTAQAAHTEQATDDAASSMARLGDSMEDMQRTAATAFAQSITDTLRLASAADDAGNRFEILDSDITTAARSVGTAVVGIGNGIALLVGGVSTAISGMLSATVAGAAAAGAVVERLRAGQLSGLGSAAGAAFNASLADSPITAALARFTEGRLDAAESIFGRGLAGDGGSQWGAREQRMADAATAAGMAAQERALGAGRGASAGGGGRSGPTEAETYAAADRAKRVEADQYRRDQQRARELSQMRADRELSTEILRVERERAQIAREVADSWAEQVTHSEEYARIQARIRGLSQESVAANEVRIIRARGAGQRAEGAISQRAELDDARDPAVQQERLDEMRRAHTIERERAHLVERYELQRSYTDRMEELHGSQFDSTQALAESTADAFQGMGTAVGNHILALAQDRESGADAVRGIAADTLEAVSKQALVKGSFEMAEGAAALAGVVTAPLAVGHFAAGAAYFGVAALAGVGAAALAPSKPSVPAASARAESTERPLGLGGSAANDNNRSAGTTYNINFNSQLYGLGGAREAARAVVRTINRGGLQGGVQLAPGALQATGSGS